MTSLKVLTLKADVFLLGIHHRKWAGGIFARFVKRLANAVAPVSLCAALRFHLYDLLEVSGFAVRFLQSRKSGTTKIGSLLQDA